MPDKTTATTGSSPQSEKTAKFTKLHGIGNDYIYFDCTDGSNSEILRAPEKYAVVFSDRRFGIGGDGIILLCDSDTADFKMRMFNADGSEGRMCGNGLRCIAKFAYDEGRTNKDIINIETLSGIKQVKLFFENNEPCGAEVDMGPPDLSSVSLPVNTDLERVIEKELTFAHGRTENCTCVSMGNPHCVIFVDGDIDNYALEVLGTEVEASRTLFPQGVNTEIVCLEPDGSLKMRVWERGSGETWACGTGACAVFTAAAVTGRLGACRKTTVHLRGGDLSLSFDSNGHIILTGNAVTVFRGEVKL